VFYFGVLQHLIHGFPLSGPESGHTERRATRKSAAVATVLFHPDFNRRLRNRTESADPSPSEKKALAGLGFVTLTAGGDFHPALRTSAARLSGLHGTMPKHSRASKRDSHGNLHVRHDGRARTRNPETALGAGFRVCAQEGASRNDCSGEASLRLRRKLILVAKALWMILFCSNR
jgi:hypothetical protein